MLNPAIKKIQDRVNELSNSNFIERAEKLFEDITLSNINPSYVEVKREFLNSFSGQFEYCKNKISGSAEIWEKKEYLQVIEGNIGELEDLENWFIEMKEMDLV